MTRNFSCLLQRFYRYLVLSAAIAFSASCNFSKDPSHSNLNAEANYASLLDSTQYVGMSMCRQCHSTIYDSYIQTGMGQSFGLANRLKSSAHFDEHVVIRDSVNGYLYHPGWDGDSLYLLEFLMRGKDTVYQRKERINYIVGSGQHTNSHIRNLNGYLYQVPATYYTQKGQWDLPPGFEGGFNSRFNRKIELECMSCHNGMPELVSGSENKYLKIPNGIDCERCHGPGSKHVAEKMNRNLVDTSKFIDYSIVNPSKLPIALQMDVCQRCHIQGNVVLNEGKSFSDFRPGMKLSSVMNVFMPVYKGDEDAHIMASHAERLKMSKCFLVSAAKAENGSEKEQLKPYKNALTCITCHNPHISVRKTGKEVFNNACLSCHDQSANSSIVKNPVSHSLLSCTESEVARMKFENNCVTCHMPKNGSIDIPHVRVTDHFIRIPVSDKEVGRIREFIGLACINNEKVDSITRAKAFIAYFEKFSSNPAFLDSAEQLINIGGEKNLMQSFHVLVHLYYLKENYEKVLEINRKIFKEAIFPSKTSADNRDAWTAYRIGQSYMESSELKSAIEYYQLAVNLAAYQPDFRNKLASAQHDAGMVSEAEKNYLFIMKENPEFVSAYTNYGYLRLTEFQDVKQAEQMYDRALSLDPLNEQAMINKSGVLIYRKRFREAEAILKSLISRYPANAQAKDLYKRVQSMK